jgi:hypothetical protein
MKTATVTYTDGRTLPRLSLRWLVLLARLSTFRRVRSL